MQTIEDFEAEIQRLQTLAQQQQATLQDAANEAALRQQQQEAERRQHEIDRQPNTKLRSTTTLPPPS